MEEMFEIVDENDSVIGTATRKECHSNPKLIHRGIYIVVVNDKGEILLQKRSMKKDLYKGLWDISVGGHNIPGESYEDAAKRELKEELGIKVPLEKIGKLFLRLKNETEFDTVFLARVKNERMKYEKEEIDEIKFFTAGDIKKLRKNQLPEKFWNILNCYLKKS